MDTRKWSSFDDANLICFKIYLVNAQKSLQVQSPHYLAAAFFEAAEQTTTASLFAQEIVRESVPQQFSKTIDSFTRFIHHQKMLTWFIDYHKFSDLYLSLSVL